MDSKVRIFLNVLCSVVFIFSIAFVSWALFFIAPAGSLAFAISPLPAWSVVFAVFIALCALAGVVALSNAPDRSLRAAAGISLAAAVVSLIMAIFGKGAILIYYAFTLSRFSRVKGLLEDYFSPAVSSVWMLVLVCVALAVVLYLLSTSVAGRTIFPPPEAKSASKLLQQPS